MLYAFSLSGLIMTLLQISKSVVAFGPLVETFSRGSILKWTSSSTKKLTTPLRVLAEPFSSVQQPSREMVLDPLVVCGPSGVGKGTIIQKYMDEYGGKEAFQFSVSHTTRSPRPGEVDGVHYHFVPIDDIKKEIEGGGFLEHAEVHGNYYGTSWQSLKDVQMAGKRCLLDIDVQGVKNIKRMESETLKPRYIFISPPSMEVLQERLIGRGTETEESVARRTANAKSEMEYGQIEGNFDAIVVNHNLDEVCREFAAVIHDLYDEELS